MTIKSYQDLEMDYCEYVNSCSGADKLLLQKVYDYEQEGYFDDMMFRPGSIVSKFIEYKHEVGEGSCKTFYEDINISICDSYYQFYVKEIGDCAGIVASNTKKVFIDPENAENDVVILHEMIHIYEEMLTEYWPFFREILILCLYNDLKFKIPDLDDKILDHTHTARGVDISTTGGEHGVLFLLKSLDLDTRFGFELGTVCGYGRNEMFNCNNSMER